MSATTGGDVVELGVQDDGTGLEIDPASGASILVANVETVVFFAGTGADVLTVGELRGSGVATLELGLGTVETRTGTVTVTETVPNGSGTGTVTVTREIPRVTTVDDNVADSVLVHGSSLDDQFTLNTEAPDVVTGFYRKVRVSRRVTVTASYSYELILAGSRRIEGDVVRFETGAGNDRHRRRGARRRADRPGQETTGPTDNDDPWPRPDRRSSSSPAPATTRSSGRRSPTCSTAAPAATATPAARASISSSTTRRPPTSTS